MTSMTAQAILFDMDGTLVDSTNCVESIWGRWAQHQGMDLSHVLAVSHGRRTIDSLRDLAPHLDIEREAEELEKEELESEEGVEAVPGAAALLGALPADRWAVVTSAGRTLAKRRLQFAGLPVPGVLVSADDVRDGKPDPSGYLMAAQLLGIAPEQCLVIEDTPAGLLAGRAAGMQVLGITTTFPMSRLLDAPCIDDFRQVRVRVMPRALELQFPYLSMRPPLNAESANAD